MALAGRQGVSWVLIEDLHGRGGLDEGVGEANGQAVGEVDQAPALGLVGLSTWNAPGVVSGRAPLINSAFISAGLLVRPRLWKNSCMRASAPETSAAARLVPDS